MKVHPGMKVRFLDGPHIDGRWTPGKTYEVGGQNEDVTDFPNRNGGFSQYCFIEDDFGRKIMFLGFVVGKHFERIDPNKFLE